MTGLSADRRQIDTANLAVTTTPQRAPRANGLMFGFLAAYIVAVGVVAVAFPLLTYTVSLAAFGLPHVLAELRYVDARFNTRLSGPVRWGLIGLLGLIVLARLLRMTGYVPGWWNGAIVELGLVVGLVAVSLPVLIRGGILPTLLGIAGIGAVGAGIYYAPVETLLFFAVAHNLTPIGFLAERLRGRARVMAMGACLAMFVGVPVVILSGWPFEFAASLGLAHPDYSLLPAGELADHFKAYLPANWHFSMFAVHAFTAAVFLQCMHYTVVIGVLPRLDADAEWSRPASLIAWPNRRTFAMFLVGTAGLLFAAFAVSFDDARTFYGLAAAIHAWLEIPILLIAVALPFKLAATATPA